MKNRKNQVQYRTRYIRSSCATDFFLLILIVCILPSNVFTLTAQTYIDNNGKKTNVSVTRHLITYASNDFFLQAAYRLISSAQLKGGFNLTRIYTPDDLDRSYKKRNHHILSQPLGGGYWIYKSYILMDYLYSIAKEDDIVCYMDSMYEFLNTNLPISKWIEESPHIVITVNKPTFGYFNETNWTKRDTFIVLGIDEKKVRKESPHQIWGGFICVRKSFIALQFLVEWFVYTQDGRIVMDSESELGEEFEEFIEHRHDQSILSLLSKKWKIKFHHFPDQIVINYRNPSPLPNVIHDNTVDSEKIERRKKSRKNKKKKASAKAKEKSRKYDTDEM